MSAFLLRLAGLLTLIAPPLLAQSILDGFVHDSAGRPIPGATVFLQRESARVLASTVTDSAGKFRFASP